MTMVADARQPVGLREAAGRLEQALRLHRHGRHVGAALQHLEVLGIEGVPFAARDLERARDLAARPQRDHHVAAHAGARRAVLEAQLRRQVVAPQRPAAQHDPAHQVRGVGRQPQRLPAHRLATAEDFAHGDAAFFPKAERRSVHGKEAAEGPGDGLEDTVHVLDGRSRGGDFHEARQDVAIAAFQGVAPRRGHRGQERLDRLRLRRDDLGRRAGPGTSQGQQRLEPPVRGQRKGGHGLAGAVAGDDDRRQPLVLGRESHLRRRHPGSRPAEAPAARVAQRDEDRRLRENRLGRDAGRGRPQRRQQIGAHRRRFDRHRAAARRSGEGEVPPGLEDGIEPTAFNRFRPEGAGDLPAAQKIGEIQRTLHPQPG